ncbi:MAG: hypothetical protein KBT45_06950 [Bacteroidales bacterium]|nr:hypothetical protein [Candidatus Colimorpha pelethequi]
MNDIENTIEQIHHANREKIMQESHLPQNQMGIRSLALRLSIAAMGIIAVIVTCIMLYPHQEAKPSYIAKAEVQHSEPQPIQQKQISSPSKPDQHTARTYAYSETSEGIRVYCENNCNADEVIQQMQSVILTLK